MKNDDFFAVIFLKLAKNALNRCRKKPQNVIFYGFFAFVQFSNSKKAKGIF